MRILLLVLMSLMATTAMARSPWYVGGGVGVTNYQQGSAINDIDPDAAKFDIDSWANGYQLFGGYQLGEQWAIEAGYINFGETSDFDPNALSGTGADLKFESTGFYVNGQYHVPIGGAFSLDLSGGWMFGEAKAKSDLLNQKDDYSTSGAMLGLAFTWQATESLYLRLPLNYFTVDYDNVIKNPWRVSLDLIWNF